jgi:trigger factor
MPPEEATEAEIDRQVELLRSYRTTFEDVEEDRGAQEDDMVLCDVENISNLREYEGENRMFALNNERLHKEFVDGLLGMKKDEEKEISWTIEREREGEKHEATFAAKVKVNAIRKAVTPVLTEDNVKDDFGFDTIAELRDAVKEEIEEDKKRSLPNLKEDRVVEELGKRVADVELPEAYENQVFQELANEFLTSLQRQGMSLDMYLGARQIDTDAFLADLHKQAAERARQGLALDALAKIKGFVATLDDVREEFVKAGVENVEASMEEFRKDGRISAIRESIRRTKAVQWLVENANVTEVDEVAERNNAEASKETESEDAE